MPEITTTVVAKSPHGIKVQDKGPWWNFSKYEFRGERFDESVKKGDQVWIEYQEKEYEGEPKFFISQIARVTSASQTARDEPFPAIDEFPPEEGFPGDEAGTPYPSGAPDAPESPSEAPGQDLWAKDRLRARTDCIACATGIYKSCLEAGIYKEFPSAETVVAYAATLELWAKETA